jgi:hypothetical protein
MRAKTAQNFEQLLKESPKAVGVKTLTEILKLKTLEELTEFEFLTLVETLADTFLAEYYRDDIPSVYRQEAKDILTNSKGFLGWNWQKTLRVFFFGQDVAEIWFDILEHEEREALGELLLEYLKKEILDYKNLDPDRKDLEELVIDYFRRELKKRLI